MLDEPCEGSRERLIGLVRAIEADVIPRLAAVERGSVAGRAVRIGDGAVTELAQIAVERDTAAAIAYVEGLLAQGATIEAVFLDLLTPAARYLGSQWVMDDRDFSEVTLGLCRLQQTLRKFGPSFQRDAEAPREHRRILLTAAPGEQHTFGVYMVGEFFRRGGWDVQDGPLESEDALVALVRGEWYSIVGFSLAALRHADALTACVRRVRDASRNGAVGIMVGGPLVLAHPERVARVGADTTAADGAQACARAEELLARSVRRG